MHTHSHTHPQVLVEHGVGGVGLDACLPLALAGLVGQQVGLDVPTEQPAVELQSCASWINPSEAHQGSGHILCM